MLPPRDVEILRLVARYDTLTRAQINRLLFPDDAAGRITRKRLQSLLALGLVNQTSMRVANPAMNGGVTAPVYYPSARGQEFLNGDRPDGADALLLNTTTPSWLFLYHFVAVAETHLTLDAAAALRPDLQVAAWYGERSLRDPKATAPEHRYWLYAVVAEAPKRVVCVPDAAFLLAKDGYRKAFYLEQDRDTTRSADRVAAQKCGGYAGLAARQLHRRHFPDATEAQFTVLAVAPTARRRDALRHAVAKRPGADLWRFAALPDLTAESFLSRPVWHPCAGDPRPLVKGGPG